MATLNAKLATGKITCIGAGRRWDEVTQSCLTPTVGFAHKRGFEDSRPGGCWQDIAQRTHTFQTRCETCWKKIDYSDVFGYNMAGSGEACRFRFLVNGQAVRYSSSHGNGNFGWRINPLTMQALIAPNDFNENFHMGKGIHTITMQSCRVGSARDCLYVSLQHEHLATCPILVHLRSVTQSATRKLHTTHAAAALPLSPFTPPLTPPSPPTQLPSKHHYYFCHLMAPAA